ADAVGRRLSVGNHQGRTINIKVRYLDFTTLSRSITIDHSTDSGRSIAREAKQLLAKVEIKPGVRLLGVGVTNLGGDGSRQLRLGEEVDLWDEAERTVDEIRDRFGSGSIGPAVLAEDGLLRVKEKGQQQWGPSV
ncbi:MAG: DinB/UmuC family translesion DNA polymerase, partial [Acidimicrobiales bacterium]